MKKFTLITALLALCAPQGIAQDTEAAAEKKRPTPESKLRKALTANAALPSVRFTTVHRKLNDAAMANFRVQGRAQNTKGRKVRTSGVWSNDLLSQSFGDEEKIVFRGRRMIAMDDDNDWTLRRGHRAGGKELPFVLDPMVLFEALKNAEFQVVNNSVGDIDGKPVMTYTAKLTGDAANGLLWAGAIPSGKDSTPGAAGGIANMVMFAAGGAGFNAPKANRTVEVAISFDPATQKIYRVHGRSSTKGAGGAMGIRQRVVVGGFGQQNNDDDEDEDDEEEEKNEKLAKAGAFKDGLSVLSKKKMKKLTVVEFTYDFKDHGQATVSGLDATAKRLLGLPGGK